MCLLTDSSLLLLLHIDHSMISADGAFEGYGEELLCLYGKLHWELVHYLFGVAVDYQGHGVLGGDAALVAVENLVLGNLGGCGFVFHYARVVEHVDVGECVGAACGAEQQGVTLGVVAAPGGLGSHLDKSAVGILRVSCRDALADYGGARIFAQMYHLGAGVGLLVVVGDGHAVKFADARLSFEYGGGVFPCNGRAGLHLRPREFAVVAAAESAFGHEVVDTALAVLVAGPPVLHC